METVDVLVTPPETGGGTGDDGEWVDGTPGVPFVVHAAHMAPRTAEERTDPRTPAIIDGATLYIDDPTVVLTAGCELLVGVRWDPDADGGAGGWVDGVGYSIEGDPGIWGDAGVEVAIKRWQAVVT